MHTKQLSTRVARLIRCAVLAALSFAAVTPALAAYLSGLPAVISVPADTPAGTVVARGYVSPQEFCGEGTCRLVLFYPIDTINNPMDGFVGGPTVPSKMKGFNMQVLVNGRPQMRLKVEQPPIVFSSKVEVQLIRDDSKEFPGGTVWDGISFWFFAKTMTKQRHCAGARFVGSG